MTLEEIAHILSTGCGKKVIVEHDENEISAEGLKTVRIYPEGIDPKMGYIRTFTTGTAQENIIKDFISSFAHKNF